MPHPILAALTFATLLPVMQQPSPLPGTGRLAKPVQRPSPLPTVRTGPLRPAKDVAIKPRPSPRATFVPLSGSQLAPAAPRALQEQQRAAREQQEKERKIALCNADRGTWTATVKGLSLSASGTDVDEIYGKISVVNLPEGRVSNSRISTRAGWGRTEIWASKENVNIGKTTQTNLSTVTIVSNSPVDAITLSMELYDEDDGRGGSNDEFFYLPGSLGPSTNIHRFDVYVPPCRQAAEFERNWQVQLIGRPAGPARGNSVKLHVRVEISRKYN